MSKCSLKFGDLIWVNFPEQAMAIGSEEKIMEIGHEQSGKRPAICIFNPHDLGTPRYELILVAPVTSKVNQYFIESPLLYPPIPQDPNGLSVTSYVLLDQIRAIDIRRIVNYNNQLSSTQIAFLRACIKKILPK